MEPDERLLLRQERSAPLFTKLLKWALQRLHVRDALTRKNFLFAGSERAAHSAAVLFSVLGSCALCGLDPIDDLRWVMLILARGVVQKNVHQLLPRNFPGS